MFARKPCIFAVSVFVITAGALRAQQATGDSARGQELFEGKGGCLACHRVNDKGPGTVRI